MINSICHLHFDALGCNDDFGFKLTIPFVMPKAALRDGGTHRYTSLKKNTPQ
jgi:hypothetical protein